MRMRGLDLNHLVTLETLLTERNLTRAAEHHLLTQPAISNALTRLRDYFGDDLLVRRGRDMERTPFAEQLLPSLRVALAQLQSVALAKPAFDPVTVSRTVRIVTSDYVAQVLLPRAIRHFHSLAPNVTLAHVPMSDEAVADFQRGELDAMISPLGPDFSQQFPHRQLYTERWACVARRGNTSVPDSLTADDYYQLPRVSPSYRHFALDSQWRSSADLPPRPAALLPFSAIPILVSQTDYVAVLPERMVQMCEVQLGLRRIALVPPPPELLFSVYWHPEHSMDAFILWMLEQLVQIGAAIDEAVGAE
jgi:DNA-binding transcriptional LysR family regulator